MSFPIPKLDRRRFGDLFKQTRERLASYAPEWTNHNYSDPGITLLELLVFFTDILYYRLDYLGKEHLEAYLRILRAEGEGTEEDLARWRKGYFAAQSGVVPEDLKTLVGRLLEIETKGKEEVLRVHLFTDPDRRLVSAIPILKKGELSEDLARSLTRALEPLRPITLRLKVEPPRYTGLSIEARIVLKEGSRLKAIEKEAVERFSEYLSPSRGLKGQGWPPGRALCYSEAVAILEDTSGIDGVGTIRLRPDPTGRKEEARILPAPGAFFRLSELRLIRMRGREEVCWWEK
ncbi:hypothetical protein [Thermosulfuriphilus sp.]